MLWTILASCWVDRPSSIADLLVTAFAWSFRTYERCLAVAVVAVGPITAWLWVWILHSGTCQRPVPPAYSSVAFVGPGCATPVDTEYYQRKVRGRGAGRRPHDLVLQFFRGQYGFNLIGLRGHGWTAMVCGLPQVACQTRDRESSVGGFEASGIGARNQRAAKFSVPTCLGLGRSGRLLSEGCLSSPKQGHGTIAQQAAS